MIVYSVVTHLFVCTERIHIYFWLIAYARFNANNIFVNICVKKMEFDTEEDWLVSAALGSFDVFCTQCNKVNTPDRQSEHFTDIRNDKIGSTIMETKYETSLFQHWKKNGDLLFH